MYDNLEATPQLTEYLQCVKEPTNGIDKNAVSVVRTTYCKEEMVGHVEQNISMIVSMFLSLPHCALHIFANRKRVNHEGEYRLEIPKNFNFYGPKNVH